MKARQTGTFLVVDSSARGAGGSLVEFRILGPFEVVKNGWALLLGGPQQRALLAVLLLHRSAKCSPSERLVA